MHTYAKQGQRLGETASFCWNSFITSCAIFIIQTYEVLTRGGLTTAGP